MSFFDEIWDGYSVKCCVAQVAGGQCVCLCVCVCVCERERESQREWKGGETISTFQLASLFSQNYAIRGHTNITIYSLLK
jgi:hypothetical protein